jgi:N-acetyl-anhydromuramyl-L-alanine amidase AmpD
MIEIIDKKIKRKTINNSDKTQIILVHTSRKIEEYLTSLKYRHNGNYNKIPHYVISREGRIIQLLDDQDYSEFFNDPTYDNRSIVISLENLGWLEKEPLSNQYVNWIGDIYNGVVYEKKWRDYFFWQPYTEEQINSAVELTKKIFEGTSIKKSVIGHNTKINGIEKFEGVVTRSNYDSESTDVNPSFDFEIFLKKIENE